MLVFLLTDIEKSTEKWERHRGKMGDVLARHDAILKEVIEDFDGQIVKHTGDGIFAIFEQGAPLHCAIEIQKRFAQENWGDIDELRIRIGLHAGEAERRGNDYFGSAVNRTARIMAAAWGGQILLSPEVKDLCSLPSDALLKDLGVHLLHDLGDPQQIYGLQYPNMIPQEFPPIHSLSAHPHSLPSQATAFVGRENEIDELKKMVDNPRCRLINLVGPGGIGKTRLALQVAAEKIENFKDGVYFVPLDAMTIGSIQFLVFTIADSLKFSFYSREDPKIQLLNYLRRKKMLLIMDNFEHLINEAELLVEIFENAPDIKFLVTSRERLRLKGEWIMEISGLDMPKNHRDENFKSYGAIQLFIESAKRIKPDFVLSNDDYKYVMEICKLVEGIPLGIELAASWVRSLSNREIVQEIDKGIDFLTSTLQDVPTRHQSLRAVFDYSWNLLSSKEQKIYGTLSVFRDGFQKEAAEKVAHATLNDLSLFSDKSLVRRTPQGRYEMLQILRKYAAEKLEEKPDLKKQVNDIHCCYYANFIDRRSQELRDKYVQEFLNEVGREIENLRSAWQWAVENTKIDELQKLLKSIYYFYEMRGWLLEGEQICRMTSEMLRIKFKKDFPDNNIKQFYGRVISRWAGFCRRLSKYEKARELLEESYAIFKELGVEKDIAFALNELGVIAYRFGKFARAKQIHQDTLEIRKKLANRKSIAVSLNNLGVVASSTGNYEEARSLHEQAIKIREDIDDQYGLASSLNNLGNVMNSLGNSTDAKKLCEKSLEIRRKIGDRPGIGSSLNNLGMIVEKLGDYTGAKRLFEESIVIKNDIGDQRAIANTLDNLGRVSLRLGDKKEARKQYREALKILKNIKAIPTLLAVLVGIADLFSKEDKDELALKCVLAVLHHPAGSREVKEAAEKISRKLATTLSETQTESIKKTVETGRFEKIIEDILMAIN